MARQQTANLYHVGSNPTARSCDSLAAKWPCGEEELGNSLFVLVFIVFLVLKLVGVGVVATWSWWLVCLPLFIPFLFALAVLSIGGGLTVLLASLAAIFGGRRK